MANHLLRVDGTPFRGTRCVIHYGGAALGRDALRRSFCDDVLLPHSVGLSPIVVHSGYRTPQTNAAIEGAARNSLHMWGMAADFHIPGVSIDDLWQECWSCPMSGGVGYYPSGWVHMDVGPNRRWNGL